jgi:hypothetical protein
MTASQGLRIRLEALNVRIDGRVALLGVCNTYTDRENAANWTLSCDAKL